MAELRPAAGERQRQQEREQHLDAGQRNAELVQQLDQLSVEALFSRLLGHRRRDSNVPVPEDAALRPRWR